MYKINLIKRYTALLAAVNTIWTQASFRLARNSTHALVFSIL